MQKLSLQPAHAFSFCLRTVLRRVTFCNVLAPALLAGGLFASGAGFSPAHAAPQNTPQSTLPAPNTRLMASPINDGARLAQSPDAATTGEGHDVAPNTSPQGALPVDLDIVKRLKVAGQLVAQSPRRVGNLDVLAPIVPLLNRVGASASRAAVDNIPGNLNTPTQDQVFQINLPNGAPVVLTVGKAVAYVEGREQSLRAAPLVMDGEIWLPIFSLAPLLGAAARLEPDGTLHLNPTVQSVELFPAKGVTVLTVKTSAPLRPDGVLMRTMDNPPKLYLDFPGYSMGFDAANSTGERVVSGPLGEVSRVRAAQFQDFPDTTRVVLDLKKEMTGLTMPLPDKTLFALYLVPPGGRVVAPVMAPPTNATGSLRGRTSVIAAGLGGQDAGAVGARSREKNHALDIARRLASHLRNKGANVLMTRDGDYFISLQGRTDFANTRQADIFFSVHINSYQKSSAGTETFFYTGQSAALAREVHNELVKATGLKNRGVSQARFFVIRKTTMPSILTETAFISNPREEALLVDAKFRERVARGMAQGVVNYAARYLAGRTTAG